MLKQRLSHNSHFIWLSKTSSVCAQQISGNLGYDVSVIRPHLSSSQVTPKPQVDAAGTYCYTDCP